MADTASASFDLEINITNRELLLEYAQEISDIDGDMEEAVLAAVVNPHRAPLDCGYELIGNSARNLEGKRYAIKVSARVFDRDAFLKAAKAAYVENWSDESWWPADLGEALFEHAVGSSASPSPDAIGVEIIGWDIKGEAVAPIADAPVVPRS